MPIQFYCGECGQLLRVPETAAGKQARCPRCQSLMPVPTAGDSAAASAPLGSGGGTVQSPSHPQMGSAEVAGPLSPPANPFAGEALVPLPPPELYSEAPASLNPYASPASAGQGYTADYYRFGPRTGLPWENEARTIGCFFRTMSAVLGSPARAFSIMRREGGIGGPLLYNLYAVSVLLAIGMVFLVPFLAVMFAMDQQNNGPGEITGITAGIAILGVMYLVMLVVIVPLVGAAAMHVALLMVDGAKQGFETTFRVMCYAYYSALVPATFLNLVPYLGWLATTIWIVVLLVYGLARGHEIAGGKATVAVVLPLIACCGAFIGLISVAVWQIR